MITKHLLGFTALLVLIGSATPASAGWEVINLHPAGSTHSHGFGASNGQQVGDASIGGAYHAGIWSGTAASWMDLNPAGYMGASSIWGVSGEEQVGYASNHAALWRGTARSFVDLHPTGYQDSYASGVFDGQQVGYAHLSMLTYHASLWNGTAGSWVNLNPAGNFMSHAYDTNGVNQVGSVGFSTDEHATMWSGTAASHVDLHPAGAYGYASAAYSISDGQQVGHVGGNAALWSGTAASWVNLSPAGYGQSFAWGVSNGRQAGYAWFGGSQHAGMWSGTAASWIDLHSLLGANYTSSQGRDIDVRGDEIWVTGWASDSVSKYTEAVLWHYVVPEPSGFLALGSGLLALGGLSRRRR